MSSISKSMLNQIFRFYHVCHPKVIQQTLSVSTSVRFLAESTDTGMSTDTPLQKNKAEYTSFDSVPVHIGPIGKIVMVLGGLYRRLSDVPDTIPNRAYQKTKDKFRARCVVVSVFGTGILCFVAAKRGKNARKEGKQRTDDVFNMHRGKSRVHEQLELQQTRRKTLQQYSSLESEINK